MSYEEYVEFFEYNRRITYLLYSMDYCVYEYYVNKGNDNIESDYDYSELYLKDALELAGFNI